MHPSAEVEAKRLDALRESARQHVVSTNQRVSEAFADIAKEKTQYFEKIALASAGTIALVVSFVGSHQRSLHPQWLLRSALVVLFLSMVTAMFRNWQYPFYVTASYAKHYHKAMKEQEEARRNYVVGLRPLAMEDGQPIDVDRYVSDSTNVQNELEKKVAELQKKETFSFNLVKYVEFLTLALVVTGMSLLIALAWKNF